VQNQNRTQSAGLTSYISLATNDYIELFVRNITGTQNITMNYAHFSLSY